MLGVRQNGRQNRAGSKTEGVAINTSREALLVLSAQRNESRHAVFASEDQDLAKPSNGNGLLLLYGATRMLAACRRVRAEGDRVHWRPASTTMCYRPKPREW
jgi:hypothetical protein